MEQLWAMADGLASKKVRVSDLNALDEVRWFSDLLNRKPNCRSVAEHARDIYGVDFRFPIILSPTGEVLDGMHRLCKAQAVITAAPDRTSHLYAIIHRGLDGFLNWQKNADDGAAKDFAEIMAHFQKSKP
jgi:hypothetical protein